MRFFATILTISGKSFGEDPSIYTVRDVYFIDLEILAMLRRNVGVTAIQNVLNASCNLQRLRRLRME